MLKPFLPRPLHDRADNPGGGDTDTVDEPETEDAPEDEPNEGREEPEANADGKRFTQEEVNEMMGKAREEGRTAKEKEMAEERQKEQGKYKELYENQKSTASTLEEERDAAREERDALAARLNSQIDSQIEDWPEKLTKNDPGPDNPRERMQWVEDWADVAEDMKVPPKAPSTEGGSGNRPSANPNASTTDEPESYRFQEKDDATW